MSLGELFGLLIESSKGAEGPGLPLRVPPLHHHTQVLQESKCNKNLFLCSFNYLLIAWFLVLWEEARG